MVMKVFPTQLIPNVFDRIEFGSEGRKFQKVDVFWCY